MIFRKLTVGNVPFWWKMINMAGTIYPLAEL